jgi:phosphatidylglycerol:prolipoprotein diacylglycerol transferase
MWTAMISSLVLLSIKIGIDPTILDQGGVEITWHGVFTAVGVVMGVAVSAWFARSRHNEDTIYNIALCLVIGGIIGARALYVIENWSQFKDDLGDIFAVNTGGISIYGALIGGTIGAWLYGIIRKVPNIPKGADIASIGAYSEWPWAESATSLTANTLRKRRTWHGVSCIRTPTARAS